MKKAIYTALTLAGLAIAAASPLAACAQEDSEVLVIEPLFQYPQAPDTIGLLERRSDYIVEHFWDPMDFSKKESVDQNALNDAFQVYVSPMRWAKEEVTGKSIDNLIQKIRKNPVLLIQFTRAAEESLYGQRAIYWSDPVYLKFVDAMLANKKIPKARKERVLRHKQLIENSMIGDYPKPFDYTTPAGTPAHYEPTGVITVIEFGDPTCDECRYGKLKMETDVTFSDLVDRGLVNVLFVLPDPEEGWQTDMTDFSPKWHVGASDTVSDIYDIRNIPSFYVIGRDGKILAKNIDYRHAMALAVSEAKKAEGNTPKQ